MPVPISGLPKHHKNVKQKQPKQIPKIKTNPKQIKKNPKIPCHGPGWGIRYLDRSNFRTRYASLTSRPACPGSCQKCVEAVDIGRNSVDMLCPSTLAHQGK